MALIRRPCLTCSFVSEKAKTTTSTLKRCRNYGDSERIGSSQGWSEWAGMHRPSTEDFGGSETLLHDAVMWVHVSTFVQTTKSEP